MFFPDVLLLLPENIFKINNTAKQAPKKVKAETHGTRTKSSLIPSAPGKEELPVFQRADFQVKKFRRTHRSLPGFSLWLTH